MLVVDLLLNVYKKDELFYSPVIIHDRLLCIRSIAIWPEFSHQHKDKSFSLNVIINLSLHGK